MDDAVILIVPFLVVIVLMAYLRRFRLNPGSWRELWTTTYDPKSYTAPGRRWLMLLYAATIVWAIAVWAVLTRS